MNEFLAQRQARLDAELRAKYTSEHVRTLADATQTRSVRRSRRRKLMGGGAIAALGICVAALRVTGTTEPHAMVGLTERSASTAPVSAAPTFAIESIGTTEIRWTEDTASRDAHGITHVRLEAGDARVDVSDPLRLDIAPPPGASFEQASLEGHDAVFVVVREQAAVVVAAERGTLTVRVDGKVHRLAPGGRIVLGDPSREATADGARSSRPERRPDWRKLARAGELEAARAAILDVQLRKPEDLMLAADVLRRTGHPAQAENYLRRIVEEHPRSQTAPVAAFTLGKLYLNSLGRPADAAQRFAQVRALSKDGALAEDALAREVESWSAAGRVEQARTLARGYLEQHPRGRYATTMRRYADAP